MKNATQSLGQHFVWPKSFHDNGRSRFLRRMRQTRPSANSGKMPPFEPHGSPSPESLTPDFLRENQTSCICLIRTKPTSAFVYDKALSSRPPPDQYPPFHNKTPARSIYIPQHSPQKSTPSPKSPHHEPHKLSTQTTPQKERNNNFTNIQNYYNMLPSFHHIFTNPRKLSTD